MWRTMEKSRWRTSPYLSTFYLSRHKSEWPRKGWIIKSFDLIYRYYNLQANYGLFELIFLYFYKNLFSFWVPRYRKLLSLYLWLFLLLWLMSFYFFLNGDIVIIFGVCIVFVTPAIVVNISCGVVIDSL